MDMELYGTLRILRFEGVRCSVLDYQWSLYSLACSTQHVPALVPWSE